MRSIQAVSLALAIGLVGCAHTAAPVKRVWAPKDHSAVQPHVGRIATALRQIDSAAPADREALAARYLKDFFDQAMIESWMAEAEPARIDLFARLRSEGTKPPVLLVSQLQNDSARTAMHATAMKALQIVQRSRRRDVIFVAIAGDAVDDSALRKLVERRWPELGTEVLVGSEDSLEARLKQLGAISE